MNRFVGRKNIESQISDEFRLNFVSVTYSVAKFGGLFVSLMDVGANTVTSHADVIHSNF